MITQSGFKRVSGQFSEAFGILIYDFQRVHIC